MRSHLFVHSRNDSSQIRSYRGSHPLFLRRMALLNTVVFCLSFVLATPLKALANTLARTAPVSSRPKPLLPVTHLPIKLYPPANAHCLTPLPDGTPVAPVAKSNVFSLSLLDEVGRLNRTVSSAQVAAWKQQLRQKRLSASKAARLHVLLGEYLLAHDQAPDSALLQFQWAERLSKVSDRWHGLVAYDSVVAVYYQGAYQQAAAGFHHLLVSMPVLSGFDRRTCALFARHAGACAGYHAERAKLGIQSLPDSIHSVGQRRWRNVCVRKVCPSTRRACSPSVVLRRKAAVFRMC